MDLPIVFYTTLPMTLPTVLPTALSMILPTVLTMVLPTGLPIVSSLVPDTTYIILPVLLSPYPNTSLPFYFHCIIDIEFTYHLLLYHNHSDWIKTILPILQLLISSFHLKYTFLFSHCDTDNSCPFDVHLPFVQSVIPSWYISTHLVLSNTLGDNVSCSCSFLYLSPHRLHSHSFFTHYHSPPSFPNSFIWLSSVFNMSHFSLFTTKYIIIISSISPTPLLFHDPL